MSNRLIKFTYSNRNYHGTHQLLVSQADLRAIRPGYVIDSLATFRNNPGTPRRRVWIKPDEAERLVAYRRQIGLRPPVLNTGKATRAQRDAANVKYKPGTVGKRGTKLPEQFYGLSVDFLEADHHPLLEGYDPGEDHVEGANGAGQDERGSVNEASDVNEADDIDEADDFNEADEERRAANFHVPPLDVSPEQFWAQIHY